MRRARVVGGWAMACWLVGCGGSGPPAPDAPAASARSVGSVAPAVESAPATPTVPDGRLGGLRVVDIEAPPAVVMGILDDPETYRTTLAHVRSLAVLSRVPDGPTTVTIVQGTALVHGTYTAQMERVGPDLVRYRLDETRPHDVDGAYGFAEVTPRGTGSRLTFFLAFDLGGPVRLLFGGRIQRSAMATPDRVRRLAEERAGTSLPGR